MGLLTELLGRPTAHASIRASYAPDADFWYQPRLNAAGVDVSTTSALSRSAVYACFTLLADMVGILPLLVYRGQRGEQRERATDHPAYRALRRRPNVWQTAYEWKRQGMMHLLLYGNFYNQILEDRNQVMLNPLHPGRVRVVQLDSTRRGYLYRPRVGAEVALTQEQVLHVMGLSFDGIVGVSVLTFMREAIARAAAQDAYTTKFWTSGASRRVALTVPGTLQPEQRAAMREEWQKVHAGVGNITTALLEGGVDVKPIGIAGRDAQFIEAHEFNVSDLARFLRIPPHMIGHMTPSTSWGTGIESLGQTFVSYTLMPWLVAFEQAAERDLLGDDEELFAEFLPDALLRGDLESRFRAYQIALGTSNNRPFMTPNEVRRRENLGPWEGGDERPAEPETAAGQRLAERSGVATDRVPARFATIAQRVAMGAIKREVDTIRRHATPKHLQDAAGWRTWSEQFYARHAAYVSEALQIPLPLAQAYARERRAELLARGLEVLEDWSREAPGALLALALEDAHA